jgi:Homing endonuclease associated repeat/HNH endonuclease
MQKFEKDFMDNYSDDALLDELRRVADLANGAPITKDNFAMMSRCSSSTIVRRFGTWKNALTRAGLANRCRRSRDFMDIRHLTDEQKRAIYRTLLVEAAMGCESPYLRESDFDSAQKGVSSVVIRKCFGSWKNALEGAGLEYKTRRIAPAEKDALYIKLLRDVADTCGNKSISIAEFDVAQNIVSSKAIREHFGSWTVALERAGLDKKRTWKAPTSKIECFDNLKNMWIKLGRCPNYDDMKQPYLGPKPYERIWGSFSKALSEFIDSPDGLDCQSRFPCSHRTTMTRALDASALVGELRRIDSVVGGGGLSKADVQRCSKIDVRTFEKRFGSWNLALEKAGLHPAETVKRYSEDDLFTNLMAVWEALGHSPAMRDMASPPSVISAETYYNRFGNWTKAKNLFLDWVGGDKDEKESGANLECAELPVCNDVNIITQQFQTISHIMPDGMRDKRRVATKKQRFKVFVRDGFKCQVCGYGQGDGRKLEADHKIAWSDGGRTIDENLWTLCQLCNQGKGAMRIADALP